jgi:hypothetical protein
MPAYWLKPLGVTDPPSPMPNDWASGANLSAFQLRTGPATHRKPPKMGPHDRVLFHAVIHVRLFAAAEIVGPPRWNKDPVWGLRWPWVYPCRVDTWVPLIEQGLHTTELAPKNALGRIQLGGDYAQLSKEKYEEMELALRSLPDAVSPI